MTTTTKTKTKQPEPVTTEPHDSGSTDTTPEGTSYDAAWALVKPASAFDQYARLKAMIYGPNGSGKTTLLARFKRPLIGVTEKQAMMRLRKINPAALVHLIDSPTALQQWRFLIRDPKIGERVDAVCLDSLTDLQRLIKGVYLSRQKKQQQTLEIETWGLVTERTAQVAREMRDVPAHVVIVCLDNEAIIEGQGSVHRPAVQGRTLPNDLGQYFNLCGYTFKRRTEKGLRFEVMFSADEHYQTKGTEELDAFEAPEPLLWIAKCFGGKVQDDVRARVDAWTALGQPTDDPQLDAKHEMKDGSDANAASTGTVDPFAANP